jgi:lipopolysaccharide biosynthesis glycosyltransferase
VPYLNNYQDWALFMDSDMLFVDDIAKLWNLRNKNYDVQVVQHADYVCNDSTKFFNIPQTNYPRKNWSSVMMFNCASCTTLTPEYVNTASPSALHRLEWAATIGALDARWNHLVGEQIPTLDAAVLHYTYGTPAYSNNCPEEFKEMWMQQFKKISKNTQS